MNSEYSPMKFSDAIADVFMKLLPEMIEREINAYLEDAAKDDLLETTRK